MSPIAETPQQYTQRILSHAQGQDAIKVQSSTNKKLARLVKGISTAKLRKRPAPDKWSVAEILAHLADAELVIGWRMRSILGAPGTPIQAFDQNAWVASLHYEKRDPRAIRSSFTALCARLILRFLSHSLQRSGNNTASTQSAARSLSSTLSA